MGASQYRGSPRKFTDLFKTLPGRIPTQEMINNRLTIYDDLDYPKTQETTTDALMDA